MTRDDVKLMVSANRTAAVELAIRCATDWLALKAHVGELAIPTPEMFGLAMPSDRLNRIFANGPDALGESELIELLTNANQLIQVHEAVYGDDKLPEDESSELVPSRFWMDAIERSAKW